MEGQRRSEEDRKKRELWFCLRRTLEVWGSVTGTSCRRRAVTRGPVCRRFSRILGSRVREIKLPLGKRSAPRTTVRIPSPKSHQYSQYFNILRSPTSSSLSSSPVWSGNTFPQQQEASGVRALRALRHPYSDFLVPYLTVNGFGLVINSDEWEPIHHPLCTWPGTVSVTGPKKRHSQERERPTTAPCWPGMLPGSTGKSVFLATDFQKEGTELVAARFAGHRGQDGAAAHEGCELEHQLLLCPSVSMENTWKS